MSINTANWHPIETAPWDREVLLKGVSGYVAHKNFIVNGYRIQDWHQGEWNDVTGIRLSDRGWFPLYWIELEVTHTKG